MYKQKFSILLLSLFLLVSCGSSNDSADDNTVSEESAVVESTAIDATETPVIEESVVEAPTSNLTDECVTAYDASVDYFPNKIEVTHASGFTVEYFNHYKLVTVNTPFNGAEEPMQYLLVQCGTPTPEGYDEAIEVTVPVERIVVMSTTYLPALEVLGRLDTLVGVDSGFYVTNETVQAMVEDGTVAEIGGGAEVNLETAIELEPDIIMTYASGSPDYDAHPKLQEAGLTAVLNAEYLDATPLGSAEWVDFMATFYNEEATSEAWFTDIINEYEALVSLTAEVEERPTVFASTPFDGTWYMAGGQSFAAQFLADAGATYLWADDESTGSLFLDFETVFDKASDADYWLNIGFFGTLEDLALADPRYEEFSAYQNGNVYNNDARTTANGGNDYFESAVIYPNLVLADLVKIFHPELVPDHQFVYYRIVE